MEKLQKYIPIIKKIVNNKRVQKFAKAKIKKRYLTAIVAILGSLGLLGGSDVTTEQLSSYVKENGGSAVMQVFMEPVGETGLVEEEEELPDSGVNPYVPSIDLPSWSDVKDRGIYERTRDQEYGTCVYESYDILYIESLILQGLLPVEYERETFIDVDHSYFDKQYQPGVDSGTVPSHALREAVEDGLPIRLTYQDVDSDNTKFADDYADRNMSVYDYRVQAPFEKIAQGRGADDFFRAMEAEIEKGNYPMFRISKRNDHNVAWFGEVTPYIKKEGQNRTGGGHSMAGASQYGVFEYRGEPTVYIYESAIRNGANYHLARLSVLRAVMTSWELYVPTNATTNVTPVVNKPVDSVDNLGSATIRFGERSQNVASLQRFLMDSGYSIPAGVTTFFGNQTKNALNGWQDDQFGDIYDGTVWGPMSRLRYQITKTQ